MHADELPVDDELVRGLLRSQFPQWAGLPLSRVPSDGTVNAIFRLGDALAVRAPFVPGETGIRRQAEWTTKLAPQLPLPVPAIHGVGVPTAEYPSDWLVVDWLPGRTPSPGQLADPDSVTEGLIAFVLALRSLDATGAPDAHRWGGLARDDAAARGALAQIPEVDTARLLHLWERALAAPPWSDPPVWVHDDLLPSNVLVDDAGALAAVIDFVPGVADPATVFLAAWALLPATHRERYRAGVGLDDAAWDRGIGWAIVQASVAIPYYRVTNPGMVRMGLHALREIAAHA